MSLKKQLQIGMIAVLVVIVIFMLMTSKSYKDLDEFVLDNLPRNMILARQYDKLVNRWNRMDDTWQGLIKDYESLPSLETWQSDFDNAFNQIGRNLTDSKHKEIFKSIKNDYSSYTQNYNYLERLITNRNNINQRNITKKEAAAKVARNDIEALLKNFRNMIKDLQNTIKSPDFTASTELTTSLYDAITKIETDLRASERELTIYLTVNSNSSTQSKQGRKSSANRIEQRLRSVQAFIERSLKKSDNPFHKRVLAKVSTSVKNFSSSFTKLRNVLEADVTDQIELDDQINQVALQMDDYKNHGTELATIEAEYFWERIDAVSEKQIEEAKSTYTISAIFLISLLLCGIMLTKKLPEIISQPLTNLSHKMEKYELGSDQKIDIKPSRILEVTKLVKAFKDMARALNKQAAALNNQVDINREYFDYMRYFTDAFKNLHTSDPNSTKNRTEISIEGILEQLVKHCPKIDLVKVMTYHAADENHSHEYFKRVCDPCCSPEFFDDKEEFPEYRQSTGFVVLKQNSKTGEIENYKWQEEILNTDEGLTGWYAENTSRIDALSIDNYFEEIYKIPPIEDNKILINRDHEKGLKGSLITEPLYYNKEVMDESENFNSIKKNKPLGYLFVYFKNKKTKLNFQEINFIQIVASHIAFILEADKLLIDHDEKMIQDDQLAMAREIQQNLLPSRIPSIKGLKICRAYKAAYDVGGDYYDFFKIDKERIGIVIADASGKNVTGAMLMTVFKTALSTMDLSKMTASEALSKANDIVAGNITPDKFVTAMYLIINSKSGEIEMASAGHNPLIIVSPIPKTSRVQTESKNTKGFPLGIMEGFPYPSTRFTIKKGDMIVLYTDGVTEARNVDGHEFGEEKFTQFLTKPRSDNPAQTLTTMIAEFSEGVDKQHDDITAITIEMV